VRNVVLVTFDSHRADHCGYMGYDHDTTPVLDAMAEDGLAFENAVAPGPSTPESMPVIMTGDFPLDGDEGKTLLATRRAKIRRHMAARETLAERFSRAGYDTAAFSPNPYTSRYFGFDEGFDHFEDFLGGSREELYQRMLDGALAGLPLGSVLPIRILLNWAQREEVFKPWEAFYEDIRAWTERASEPYFLWVLLMDTHDPYLVPDEYRTQSRWAMYHANYRLWRQGHEPPFSDTTHDRLVRAYDDSIAYADAFLDQLRTDLAADDPLIAVHGDHGEAFGEHGTYGHHQQLYEENIHVPFVVSGTVDRDVTAPVALRRMPDLLESLAIDGTLPEYEDRWVPAQTLDEDRIAVRGRDFKYLRYDDTAWLYDLANDASEQSPHEDLDEIVRAPVIQWDENVAERRRIADVASELGADYEW